MEYYTYISIISWIALFVLCILVHENARLTSREKLSFYITYGSVAVASLSEWLGVQLNGDTSYPSFLLRGAKLIDYILTPVTGGALVSQLRMKSIWLKLLNLIIASNTILQIITVFTGGMIDIDDSSHYTHGRLYFIYITMYFLVIVCVLMAFFSYGRNFRRRNLLSLYATVSVVIVGILFQELSGSRFRTSYLSLSVGMALMYIHYTEFSQLSADDTIKEQRTQLMLSQIKPHFLFNSLAVIRETYRTDAESGEMAITRFAEFLRHNMDQLISEHPISFSEELEHVKNYLSLQQLRFGDELDVKYELKAMDFSLPTLILQPLVENAVTHGVRKLRKTNGIITISSQEYDDRFEICVTDNGVGFDPGESRTDDTQRSHIGIKNVRERLAYTCGGELTIDSQIGHGTTVTMKIPKEK
ncbi:MAG: histidine kinase [Ruminococcus sp.]|nr:histidine kinase [Ruminococcus sp.]